ncbi:hypothetical protein HBI73_176920 [Parastagonospora nodorum]|nr:hypothetical protein HBH51_192800 [Parastagonospora nodorum]KAH4114728.1 hypothetical protein HBH47_192660 [Parastagonospora nodorum]KAH4180802.1 hypothetical protein HBH43_009440 [Parastagonospora nodorum]KAH5077152.1 hypothetical protein HBI73_176920 [Parastagonospora nodorum]KAH5208074.1 hypothetical protein HBH68_086210 [Parastagonospora nodorum]
MLQRERNHASDGARAGKQAFGLCMQLPNVAMFQNGLALRAACFNAHLAHFGTWHGIDGHGSMKAWKHKTMEGSRRGDKVKMRDEPQSGWGCARFFAVLINRDGRHRGEGSGTAEW